VVLLPVFAGADLAVNFGAGAIGDFIWLLPLIFMLFFIKKPWISGALYGVSCAIKQTPWLLAPFLLIWIYNDNAEASMKERLKRTAIFAGMAAVLFLIPNLQFILQGFSQWWDGVVTQGLSMVSELGYVPLPPHFYSITLLAVFATLIFNYAVYFDKLKHAIWVMPMVALWFSYRGLQNYFIFWMPMLVASAVYIYKERARV
jgi:uncharacterized membrane protein